MHWTATRPADASTPIKPGVTTRPAVASRSPRCRSLPAARKLVPAATATRTSTVPSCSAVSSTRTTASDPSGIMAPVMIRNAVFGCTLAGGAAPARISPSTRSRTGWAADACATSPARIAYPSIAELAKGGTSRSERTSSASTRPRACVRATGSGSSAAIRSRIRSRAWATVSNGRASCLPIVPVAVFELGSATFAVGHDVLVEARGDHLVRHGTRNAELGEGLDLIGHDLVARAFDGGDHVIDRGTGLGRAAGAVLGGDLRGHFRYRFLRGLRLAVLGLFGHRILHLTNWNRDQADTLKVAAPRLAFTRSMANRNVSLASAVSGAARNIPIKPKSEAPSSVLKIRSRGWTRVNRPRIQGAKTWLSACW